MKTSRHKEEGETNILLTALHDPAQAVTFGNEEWDLLLRLARRTRLLGRLAVCMDELGLMDKVPLQVVDHFVAARVFVDQRQRMARWEIDRILQAIHEIEEPVVLLKGSAYLLTGLPPSRGRLQSDVDLMVPATSLERFEKTLLGHGWESVNLEEYDQRYYRTWMHELPPLRHPDRGIEVDIHHTISPLTSRLNPDPEKLFRESIALAETRLRVLQPVDMVLHSAVHLFYDGEFINGLRDLVDLADLFGHFGSRAGFWDELIQRAYGQDLQRPLFYAMRYTQRLLGADIPTTALAGIGTGAPPHLILRLMDRLIVWVMVPDHPDFPQRRTAVAQWLLYVRSHWLRMPPGLLLKHLAHKQIMRWKQRKLTSAAKVQQ